MYLNAMEKFDKDKYPEKTNIKCYHCCNTFETKPIPLPFAYDRIKCKFHVKFVFCSWECMKTFVSESNFSNKNYIFSIIQDFYKHINGRTKTIKFAPPRIALQDFGGPLKIEDFRCNSDTEYKQINFPFIVSNPKIDKVENYSWIKEDSAKTTFTNSKKCSQVEQNDQLKLERPKTMKKKNTLADAMGLLRVEN